ncbi:MAG: DUF222 domain-containing protein [Actinomycetota bacterium]
MSALRSGIEELAGEDPADCTYGELTDSVAEISRAIDMLTYQLAARVNEVDRRRDYTVDGFLTATRWLATIADLDGSLAKRLVSMGQVLSEFPRTAQQLSAGELSRSRARILCNAARSHPDAYRNDEEMLLGFAHDMSLQAMNGAVRYWSNVVDDTGEQDARRQREKAYVHASVTYQGMVRLDGLLDPERGEVVLTALEAAAGPRASDDSRPASNRRAEALSEICRQWLDHGAPQHGGVRPHVNMVVDLETLLGRMGKRCELEHVGTITPETARRILCDASVSRIITDAESMPLDVGRSSRTVTPAQRRALIVRDGGCRVQGCDRPPSWCDVHHREAWFLGGETNIEDLVLVCRPHHTMIHDGVVQIE